MKCIFILASSITILMLVYLTCAIYNLNKVENFYGVLNDNGNLAKMVSDEKAVIYNYQLPTETENMQKGNWIKITFTDHRGSILNLKIIDKKNIPTEIKHEVLQ